MTDEELLHKAAEALSGCDVVALVPLYAETAVFEDVPSGEVYRGRAAVRAMFETLFSRTNVRFRIDTVRAGAGWGVLEWVWSGTTRKTGTPFEVRGVSVLELSGAAVTKETIYYDPAPALR